MARRARNLLEELSHIILDKDITERRIREILLKEETYKRLEEHLELWRNILDCARTMDSEFLNFIIETLLDYEKLAEEKEKTRELRFTNGLAHALKNRLYAFYFSEHGKWLGLASLYAYWKVRYQHAFIFMGCLLSAIYDTVYYTLVEKHKEINEVLMKMCDYATKVIELIKGYEGQQISMAHEYLSFLRKVRCYLSQMSFRITPLTLIVAQDKEGNLYCAIHVNAKFLAYSPYSRRIYPLPFHIVLVLRRKPDIKFSTRIDSGVKVVRADSDVVTAKTFTDDIYSVRKLIELLFRPYLIIRDRFRSLGIPEQAHNADICSVYFIPRRKTPWGRYRELDTETRLLSKSRAYLRRCGI